MKIFLSWSGDLSHKIAVELRDWLPFVIQSIQPYVSSEDIDKGTRWSIDIAKELEDSSFGILCVTPHNLEAPWINFEAGALSKAFNNSNVSPFLFGLKPSDLKKSPLLQFQSTLYDKKDFVKLILSINNALGKEKLDETKLKVTFDVWWETLRGKLDSYLPEATFTTANAEADKQSETSKNDALEEILELTREQFKLLRNPEILLPEAYLSYILKNVAGIDGKIIDEIEICIRGLRQVLSKVTPEQPINLADVEITLHRLERVKYYLRDNGRNRTRLSQLFKE
ncbi:toll/interleukin-1 receptor domain-containing protein [Mucilaginibacter sp. X4EP1]|uniref:toll/interleukin-1 receptor domain-containing protein n=1 Tax=Mucilaginibacter sp. X4EP1 TaxID=2723092 RepID=UPI002169429B|nr:toll/interleukin-1 receptor domain-containing protein [Mucilaginibacter sp. X4EP1]MCS3812301.1 hypothetical protein [Mucilaginibacter sp. X4EP1]